MAEPRTPGSRPGSSSAPPPAPAPAHASSSPHLPPLRTSPSSSLLGEAGDDGPPARCRTRLPGGRLRLPPPPLLATVVAGVLALPPFVDHVYRSYEVIGVVNNNGAQNSKNNINGNIFSALDPGRPGFSKIQGDPFIGPSSLKSGQNM